MAKKYSNAEIKTLKRDDVVALLKQEGIVFDSTLPFFSLRKLLLDIDDNVVESDTKTYDNSYSKEDAVEHMEEVLVGESLIDNEQPKEQKKEVNVLNDEAGVSKSASFNNELSKRLATFGRAHQSVFEIELAKRQGRLTGKISFEEELRIRQNKANR